LSCKKWFSGNAEKPAMTWEQIPLPTYADL
jgi:hypothetical protein